MNNFIQGDNFEGPGGEAEKLVWEKVKHAFRNRKCIAYSKYPIFSNLGANRKEPDILIIDKKFGIVIIEVKGISIEQIEKVEGSRWTLKNFYQKSANPIGQAQSQMFALISRLYNPDIYGKVNTKVLVALPYISKDQWKNKSFGLAGEVPIIFSDSLSPAALKRTIEESANVFTAGSLKYEQAGKLQILHAWGGSDLTGLYREIAMNNGISPLNVKDVKRLKVGKSLEPSEGLLFACKKLLEEKGESINQIYDAVLIYEGQDLVGEDWIKYNGSQPFYHMDYKALKPIDNSKPKLKRLIWAYDELQNLNSMKVPSNKEIFGDDSEIKELTGGVYYEAGIKKSEIMKVCYRTPHSILTTAHAIGMGLFRTEGMVCGYTTQKDWEDIGYEVTSGDFKAKGNTIRLERPIKNSPNPISKHYSGELISFETFTNNEDLYEELTKNIKEDIEIHQLEPKKQILIVYIGRKNKSIIEGIAKAMNRAVLNYYIPQAPRNNVTEFHWKYKEGDKFWSDDAVTIASIYEAKGNEANMVYVLGVENVAQKEGDMNIRNELFVALTRARCWVKVVGLGEYRFYDEFRKAIEDKGKFEFVYRKLGKIVDDLENE